MNIKEYGKETCGLALCRFDSSCARCKATDYLEFDHHEAKSNGGKNKDFVILCRRCNGKKGNRSATEFYKPEILELIERKLKLEFTQDAIRKALALIWKKEKDYSDLTGDELSESAKRLEQTKYLQPYIEALK